MKLEDFLEPQATVPSSAGTDFEQLRVARSIAISLKRIADAYYQPRTDLAAEARDALLLDLISRQTDAMERISATLDNLASRSILA